MYAGHPEQGDPTRAKNPDDELELVIVHPCG
jgi:hypothetical protein